MEIIGKTESLCPECFRKIAAARVAEDGKVYLHKTCPEHGEYKVMIWRRDGQHFLNWAKGSELGSKPLRQATAVGKGCPFDCGLCPDHRTSACTMVMEVTNRCDLNCPVCFASAERDISLDPDMETIRKMYENVIRSVGVCTIQLSGGEPTMRNDLPQIVAAGRKAGFNHIMVNTNGVRIARDPHYLKQLKEAGTSTIYLQFDGISDEVYRYTRGKNLYDIKKKAVANCALENIGVVIVPTIIPGVNDHQLGDIVQFAKEWIPTVRGVHFQPVCYMGRYPKPLGDEERFTIPDVIDALEAQSNGELVWKDFLPRNVDEAHCSFSSFYVLEKNGRLRAMTDNSRGRVTSFAFEKEIPEQSSRKFMDLHWRAANTDCCCSGDDFFTRLIKDSLTITCMPFQDIWSLDLERLKSCCGHIVVPDGRILPFCSYYLTNSMGERLYPTVTVHSGRRDHLESSITQTDVSSSAVSEKSEEKEFLPADEQHPSRCMVCGADLIYLENNQDLQCHYCERVLAASCRCANGHFVCDDCHRADAVDIIRSVCLQSSESDPVALMRTIRSHSSFHIHGPEHHVLVPAVILTALKNSGHRVAEHQIITAIQRGQTINGGACAFLGACGAAIGVGIAISLLIGATPYDGVKRQTVQRVTQKILGRIASYKAPRCCQRDSWLALKEASKQIEALTGETLMVNRFKCGQMSENKECIQDQCPLWGGGESE